MKNNSVGIFVQDSSAVAHARREAGAIARSVGLSAGKASDAAIIVTEAATNLVKHTPGGTILLRGFDDAAGTGLELLALNKGAGMDVARAMRDGFSTAGSPGTGLGAIVRLADEHEIYSGPDLGTVLMARLYRQRAAPPFRGGLLIGAACTPARGETMAGDAWRRRDDGRGAHSIIVSDGLGHGPLAAEASAAAIDSFDRSAGRSARETLELVHSAMKPTRGGAVAIARIEPANSTVRFCGIGNISAAVITAAGQRSMISHNGIVGHEARKFEEYAYPWSPSAMLVMHSDGLTSRWQTSGYPGIITRHPALLAGLLYRDFCRGRDDATVIVARIVDRGAGDGG